MLEISWIRLVVVLLLVLLLGFYLGFSYLRIKTMKNEYDGGNP